MTSKLDSHAWENWLARFPQAHILQTAAWGELKSRFGWKAHYLAGDNSGAMVLFRQLPLGFKIGYIPKGPVGQDWRSLWPALDALCRKERAVFLRIEPDRWQDEEDRSIQELKQYGHHAVAPIQPRRTIVVPLEGSEDQWLNRMKQKTRYNIRLAERKAVQVHESADIESFAQLMQVTGNRDGFGVHTPEYYRLAHSLFSPGDSMALLIASYEEKPLAGVMVFRRGRRSWFLFGGSSNEERNRMPAYLVQWEAMRWSARQGCAEYDLWGAPDVEEEALEAQFQSRNDGLWGVYRFKRGFGGQLRRSAGAWDRVYFPGLYRVYQWILKKRKSTIQ